MSYFEGVKNQAVVLKVLIGVIAAMFLLNLVAFKMVANIAENKTVKIQVPQYMDSGSYVIGANGASDNIYKMWGRIWFEQLTNFSYKNIDEKIKYIEPFLNKQTIFKNKSDLKEMAQDIKTNFITQKFKISKYEIKRLKKGYVEIKAKGKLYKRVGLRKDKLNGIPFEYKIIAYTKNGQVYIKSLDSYIIKIKDTDVEKKLEKNPYVNFDEIIEEDKKKRAERRAAKKKKMQQKGGM